MSTESETEMPGQRGAQSHADPGEWPGFKNCREPTLISCADEAQGHGVFGHLLWAQEESARRQAAVSAWQGRREGRPAEREVAAHVSALRPQFTASRRFSGAGTTPGM